MKTLVKLTGTNGSGKSTVSKYILDHYANTPLTYKPGRRGDRGEDYLVTIEPKGQRKVKFIILGNYDSACGGCDGIQPYSRILEKVKRYAQEGYSMLLEGVLIRGHGSLGRLIDSLPGYHVHYRYMDTPVETCIARVNQRRAARGVTEPLDPANLLSKWRTDQTGFINLKRKGVDIEWVDHRKPIKTVLGLFGVDIAREPKL